MKNKKLLLEVLFKDESQSINLIFLEKILNKSKKNYFNNPEVEQVNDLASIIEVFRLNDYVDFVINTDNLHINENVVNNVFVNITQSYGTIEYFLFFDLFDINLKNINLVGRLDYLKQWIIDIKNKNNFDYFICQGDNSSDGHYYFDSNGFGSLYENLIR
jgi:hypothetical protein